MKRLVKLVTFAAVVAAVVSLLKRRPAPPTAPPTRPAAPVTPAAPASTAPWAEPTGDGGCPEGYPVKAKLKSKIFHVEGGVLYERTVPDRCYASSAAAEADGLRPSLR